MINSVLTYNLEVISNLSKKEVKELDKVDMYLLRRATMTSSKSARILLLAEMGLLSVEYILKKKRLNYLHTILQSEESSLSKQVWEEQVKTRIKGDFASAVMQDLKDCKLEMKFSDIERMTKIKFKEIVKSAVEKACIESYIREKQQLSKGKEIEYEELKLQRYMMPGSGLSSESIARILSLRIRDVGVRGNFPAIASTSECVAPGCHQIELPQHTFSCPFLSSGNEIIEEEISYFDIFTEDIGKQFKISEIFFLRYQKRNSFLDEESSEQRPEEPRNPDPCDPGDKATMGGDKDSNITII